MTKSFLITLTAPSASGKSYLLEYIRDELKLPCLVSTTTRAKRANEVEGRDYFFISREESEAMEARGEFAELAIFGGNRYGVTKKEFAGKLNDPIGLAFLIVEPEGIDHYVAPALEVGAKHLKFFVDAPLEIRLDRLRSRTSADILKAVGEFVMTEALSDPRVVKVDISETVNKIVSSYTARLQSVLGKELSWKAMHQWDGILNGEHHPAINVAKIQDTIQQFQ
jgi:guanylate kinase